MKQLFSLLFIAFSFNLWAQDPQFSKPTAAGNFTNPAYAGACNCNTKFSILYRNQYQLNANSEGGYAYRTIVAGADGRVLQQGYYKNFLGIGGTIMNDRAGASKYAYTALSLNAAYHIVVRGNINSLVSVGLQFGVNQFRIDDSQLTFDNQFRTEIGYDPTIAGESFDQPSFIKPDAGFGINYTLTSKRDLNIFAGGSLLHMTSPTGSFTGEQFSRQFLRVNINSGARIPLSQKIFLLAEFHMAHQQRYNEFLAGVGVSYQFNENYQREQSVSLGVNYRYLQALVPYVGFTYEGFQLDFRYDYNLSDISAITTSTAAIEIGLSYALLAKRNDRIAPLGPKL